MKPLPHRTDAAGLCSRAFIVLPLYIHPAKTHTYISRKGSTVKTQVMASSNQYIVIDMKYNPTQRILQFSHQIKQATVHVIYWAHVHIFSSNYHPDPLLSCTNENQRSIPFMSSSSFGMNQGGHPQQAQSQENRKEKTLCTNAEDMTATCQPSVSLLLTGLLPHPLHMLLVLVAQKSWKHIWGIPARLSVQPLWTGLVNTLGLGLKHLLTFFNANKVTVSKVHCVGKARQMSMTCRICKLGFNKCCPQIAI